MKVTVDLPEELVRAIKAQAGTDAVSVGDLVTEALRRELKRRDFVFPVSDGGGGFLPGVTVKNMIEISYGESF